MFIVAKNTSSNTDKDVFSAASSSLGEPLRELTLASDQLTYFRRDDSGNSSGGANASTRTTGFGVIGLVQQTTSHTLYLNGASVHSASANIGSVTVNRATIGCLGRASDLLFFDGDIAEIVIYNTALSDTDRAAVESYLMNKWILSPTPTPTPTPTTSNTITITSQPDYAMGNNGGYATVSANVTGGGTLSYQWQWAPWDGVQNDTPPTTGWTNLNGTSNGITTNSLNINGLAMDAISPFDNAGRAWFRVIISSTGASSVTSNTTFARPMI
jgi:hypothetical protein